VRSEFLVALIFTPDSTECWARLSHHRGVRLSVRPSVTLWYCVKTTQDRTTRSSLWGCPKNSSLSWQNLLPLGERIPLERRRQRGYLI